MRRTSLIVAMLSLCVLLIAAFLMYRTLATDTSREVINLYYYDPALDQGPGGAQCSPAGLVAVERIVAPSRDMPREALSMLLEGKLTAQERARGLTPYFPLDGVTLTDLSYTGGVLTAVFYDPEHQTSGGSCRVSIMRAEIEATAKQFTGVDSVRIEPPDIFQP